MSIFWITLIIIILAVGYVICKKEKRKIDEILKMLALERNGKIKKVFGTYSQLNFEYNNVNVIVSAMSGGGGSGRSYRPPQTFAQFNFFSSPDKFFFRIRGKSTQTVIEKIFGFVEIQIGEPILDQQFFIQGRDQNFLRNLLNPNIQSKIIELNKGQGMEASFQKVKYFDGREWVEKPRFDVTIYKVSTEHQDYVDLIDTAILFCDQMRKLINK
jgi:hypothetical protein